jgi:hypothetical protein
MTISEVKAALGIEELKLQKGEKNWYSWFESASRRQLIMHGEIVSQIQSNPATDRLSFRKEKKEGKKGAYEAVLIFQYKEEQKADVTL